MRVYGFQMDANVRDEWVDGDVSVCVCVVLGGAITTKGECCRQSHTVKQRRWFGTREGFVGLIAESSRTRNQAMVRLK